MLDALRRPRLQAGILALAAAAALATWLALDPVRAGSPSWAGGHDLSQVGALAAALVVAGCLTGFLAGLFGVGGGTVVVPVLYEVFGIYGVPESVRMPLCIGTSLAVIVPTSITAFRKHLGTGNVDMPVLRAWILPVGTGVALGAWIATFASPAIFKGVFVAICLILALRLLTAKDRWRLGDALPGRTGLSAYGLAIGTSASLMGIGGGLVSNLVLSLYGRPIHTVVATSAGVGLLVSAPGTLGYIVAGWGRAGLPPLSLGYVSLIGCALITPLSIFTVRYGVRLSQRLNKRQMEVLLSLYLIAIAARFLVSLLGH